MSPGLNQGKSSSLVTTYTIPLHSTGRTSYSVYDAGSVADVASVAPAVGEGGNDHQVAHTNGSTKAEYVEFIVRIGTIAPPPPHLLSTKAGTSRVSHSSFGSVTARPSSKFSQHGESGGADSVGVVATAEEGGDVGSQTDLVALPVTLLLAEVTGDTCETARA